MTDTHRALQVMRMPPELGRVERDFLNLGLFGDPKRPLHVNSRYLERDGLPWLPVMGEFHYSRYPADEWERELRKMQAGGVDIVASYVIWNHHEEVEGQFRWGGQRDLARFVALINRLGLYFYLRPGPWVHAEVRNGGFPDWLLSHEPLRVNSPAYLAYVERFFFEIGRQLQGALWCDGGPVLGLQLENEYDGVGSQRGAEHITALKRIAIDAGLRVPIYTVTGWPTLDIPPREVIPVSGAYPDGFWSGETGPLPPSGVFLFDTQRAIGEMGNVGGTPAAGLIDKQHYPFFLAEAGGGMHVSYHRRPVVTEHDVAATALVQIGSGANLYGYYMYHGGTNPMGELGRLHETQASGYPNDVPVWAYDFRAPLGQYGQSRPSYGRLRTLHNFLQAFGADLAPMDAVLPEGCSPDAANTTAVRTALRGAGTTGFFFVNNHVRHHPMPDFANQQWCFECGSSSFFVPSEPINLQSGAYFIWPLGLRLGGVVMRYATAQPVTRFTHRGAETLVLMALANIPTELSFESSVQCKAPEAWISPSEQGTLIQVPPADHLQSLSVVDGLGVQHTVLILSQRLTDQCQRVYLHKQPHLLFSAAPAWVEGAEVVTFGAGSLCLYAPDGILRELHSADEVPPGLSVRWAIQPGPAQAPGVRMGPVVGWRKKAVPLAPDDAAYTTATVVTLKIDGPPPPAGARVHLQVDYRADAARLYVNGEMVDDHFYDGEPWTLGLDRFLTEGGWPALELRLIPFNAQTPLFLEPSARERVRDNISDIVHMSVQCDALRRFTI